MVSYVRQIWCPGASGSCEAARGEARNIFSEFDQINFCLSLAIRSNKLKINSPSEDQRKGEIVIQK